MALTLNWNYVVSSQVEKTTVFGSIIVMRRFRHYSLLMDKYQATRSHLRWGYWKQPVWNEAFRRLLLHFLEQNSSQQDDLRIYFAKARSEPSCSWGPSVSPYCQGSHWECLQDPHLQRQFPDRTLTSWLRGKKITLHHYLRRTTCKLNMSGIYLKQLFRTISSLFKPGRQPPLPQYP